jgi:hypothetical protein
MGAGVEREAAHELRGAVAHRYAASAWANRGSGRYAEEDDERRITKGSGVEFKPTEQVCLLGLVLLSVIAPRSAGSARSPRLW